jgi:predicted NACHT family NTPase
MEIDPTDPAMADEEDARALDASARRLNSWVAATIALLATFLGICKVKDDNIVQAMQQAQVARLDDWSFYQARNVREEVAKSTLVQLQLASRVAGADQAQYQRAVSDYQSLVADQTAKKTELEKQAKADQDRYDSLNYRDDQFDLADALGALAVSLLAVTALTHKRWLYVAALVPTVLCMVMGLAGLLGLHVHPAELTNLLS